MLMLYVTRRLGEITAGLYLSPASDKGNGLRGDTALSATGAEFEIPPFKIDAFGFGLLLDNETVLDNMEHEETGPFIEKLLRLEIAPTVPVEPETIGTFVDAVLDRWRNPFLHHRLRDIAWQSTSKMKHRVVPTIMRYYRRFGQVPALFGEVFFGQCVLVVIDRVEEVEVGGVGIHVLDLPAAEVGLVERLAAPERDVDLLLRDQVPRPKLVERAGPPRRGRLHGNALDKTGCIAIADDAPAFDLFGKHGEIE